MWLIVCLIEGVCVILMQENLFIMVKKFVFLFVISLFCGPMTYAQDIVFTPQWLPQAQFVGYYVAQEKGFFKEEGVDVEIRHPSASYPAFNRMADGSSDFITLQLLQAMIAIDQGYPLVNVLQISQHNSLLIVPRNDSIRTLDDLRNKRVGIWKVGFGETAKMLDIQHQLNIEWIQRLKSVNLLIAGAIDATLAMRYNEYWQIMASGINPKHVIAISDYGLDIPEDGLYVSRRFYEAHPEKVMAFARASRRGWEWAMGHPEEALNIVVKVMKNANVVVNIYHQRWMLKEILQLMSDKRDKGKRGKNQLKVEIDMEGDASFLLKPEQVQLANEELLRAGFIKKAIEYEQLWKGGAQ